MGFFDAPPATTTGTSSSAATNGLPDWYQQYLGGIANMGANYASQPFTPYTGARVADTTDAQKQATAGALSIGTAGNAQLPAATGMIQSGLSTLAAPAQKWTDPGVADSYMSPYTKSVVDEIGRLGNQNFNETLMPAVQDAFVGAGGSGSTRNFTTAANTARDSAANTLGQQNTALQNGYTTSAGIFGADANRNLTANTTLGQAGINAGLGLGSLGATNNSTQLGALSLAGQLGGVDQATQQKALDTGYSDFTDQRDWDINNAGKLSTLFRGTTLPTSAASTSGTTQTEVGGGSSTAQGLLSLLATLYGSSK